MIQEEEIRVVIVRCSTTHGPTEAVNRTTSCSKPGTTRLSGFLQSSKLTTDQITGASNQDLQTIDYPIAPVVRWPFKAGTSLVPPEIMPLLPTQMRRLHDLYMKAMADLIWMQGAKFTDEDFLREEGIIWINWEEVYQLYHQDALDISIVSLWLL